MWKWSSALTIVYCEVSTEFLEVHLDQVFLCAFTWGLLMLNPLSQSGNVCCVVCVVVVVVVVVVCVCVCVHYIFVCVHCVWWCMCVWCVCVLCVGHSLVPRPSHPSMCRLQQLTNAGVRRPGNEAMLGMCVVCLYCVCVWQGMYVHVLHMHTCMRVCYTCTVHSNHRPAIFLNYLSLPIIVS